MMLQIGAHDMMIVYKQQQNALIAISENVSFGLVWPVQKDSLQIHPKSQ